MNELRILPIMLGFCYFPSAVDRKQYLNMLFSVPSLVTPFSSAMLTSCLALRVMHKPVLTHNPDPHPTHKKTCQLTRTRRVRPAVEYQTRLTCTVAENPLETADC